MKEKYDDCRHGEAARAAKVAIELKPTKLGPTMPKVYAKEMGMSDYDAKGFTKVRINGKK